MGCTCEYCGAILTTRTNLHKHQKNAKYCLKMQGVDAKSDQSFVCHCGCVYTRMDSLYRHQKKCIAKNKSPNDYDQIAKIITNIQNDKIDGLLNQMVNIISTATPNSKTIILNSLEPITDEQLSGNLDHLTLNHIQDGAKGYADFANYYPLKDNIICTDRARKKIRYKNSNGELTDNARELAKRFFTAILPKNEEIINTEYTGLLGQIQHVVNEKKAGEIDVAPLLKRATSLQDMLISCRNAASGQDDEFTQEFIKHLTRTL